MDEQVCSEGERQQKRSNAGAYASILLAAALWGTLGLWNRNLMEGGLTPTGIAAVRNLSAMLLLLAVFAIRDHSVFRVKREHLKYFAGTGIIGIMLFTCCYFTCQRLCSLAVSSVLVYTAPSFVVVLSAILWKEPVTKKKLLALALTLVGCAMVCGIFSGDLTATPVGVLLGLGAGISYALYSVFGRYALAHYTPMTVTVWSFIFAGPASLVLLRPAELAAAYTEPSMWLLTAGLVVFSGVSPYLFYTYGLSRVEAGKASIIASVEPVVAALAGVLVLGESITAAAVAGIVLVLAGVIILR